MKVIRVFLKSLNEIKEILAGMGLSLGMKVPEKKKLAEKVEKDANLAMPNTSTQSGGQAAAPTAKTPPPPKAKKKPAFVIVEDEGC